MPGSISVIEGVGTALGFLRRAWWRVSGALVLSALLGVESGRAFLDREFGRSGLLFVAYLLATAMTQGALFRIAGAARHPDERDWGPGFAGFQWGRIEWRILAVTLLRGALFGLLGALAVTLLMAIYIGVAAAEAGTANAVAAPEHWRRTLDPPGWCMVGAVALVCLAILVWIAARLYLAFAATVALGRVQLLAAWPLTRGRVWRVLGAAVLVLAPAVGVYLLMRIGRDLIAPAGLERGGPAIVYSLVVGLAYTFLATPATVGLMTYLYDRLGPDDAGAS